MPTWKCEEGRWRVQDQHGLYSKTLSQNTKGWGCSSVVQCLPIVLKALGLIPSTWRKKKQVI
jgi:hypothetical protein